ncbi:MAG: extracellular solute-binding protein, partial [Thaumarchaeota archaeon]|nr:extracellular solute-binding protein [Nitrososphaerota archaeon]
GAAATLGSQYMLPQGSPRPQSPQNTTTMTTTARNAADNRYRPPEYLKFMDWLKEVSKPYAGKRIVTAFELEPASLALQSLDPDYFSYSGTYVGYELTPFIQNLVNTTLAISTKAPTYDIMNMDGSNLATFAPHLIPPQELAQKYPDITYPDIDMNGFARAGMAFSGKYPQDLIFPPYDKELGGSVFGFPQDMPVMLRFYRKDLYDKEGITPGKTWDEYLEDLKMFDDPAKGVFGAGSMTLSHPSIIFEYLNHLHSFGGKIWELEDKGLRCALNTPEAVAALENFIRLKNYSDPASASSTWAELGILMAVGRVANAIQWADYASVVNNPVQSLTAGKWDYTVNPSGPSGSFSTFGGAGVGVSRYSRNPEAAWLWLQWATGFGTQIVTLQDPIHYFTPTRSKVYDYPTVQADIKSGRLKYLKVAQDILASNKVATLITFPAWQLVRVQIGDVLSRCWNGGLTPREALKLGQENIDKLQGGPVFKF